MHPKPSSINQRQSTVESMQSDGPNLCLSKGEATLLDLIGFQASEDYPDFDPPQLTLVPRIPNVGTLDVSQEPSD